MQRVGVIIITLLYPLGVMWGMKKIVSVIITFCIVFLMVGAVSADNNSSINDRVWNDTPQVNGTPTINDTVYKGNETPIEEIEEYVPLYRYSDQYYEDVETWYQYHKPSFTNPNLRTQLYSVLVEPTMTWEEKRAVILPMMGWNDALECYMNQPDKYTVNEETGEITWDLGIGNWWANLFGNGVDESTLPQSIAEGEGLYKLYIENYQSYIQALREAGIR